MLRGATRVSCCLAGCRRSFSTPSLVHDDLLEALRRLDTASLCDADKILRQKAAEAGTTKDACDGILYRGIQLMDTKIRPINPAASNTKLVGYAFTVQCTVKNDFLAVLRGLIECCSGSSGGDQVLVVDTLNSVRAVSGELFASQAAASENMVGLLIDGPVRDTAQLQHMDDIPVFATHACPYAGTIQHPGLIQVPIAINGGAVTVNPGDVIFGDRDGVVVGNVTTMQRLRPLAEAIVATEGVVRERIATQQGTLETLTNSREHIAARLRGEASSLEFRRLE